MHITLPKICMGKKLTRAIFPFSDFKYYFLNHETNNEFSTIMLILTFPGGSRPYVSN